MPFALDIGIEPGPAALVLSTFAVGGLFGPMAFAALGDRVDLRVLFAASALFNVLALLGFAHAGSAEIVSVRLRSSPSAALFLHRFGACSLPVFSVKSISGA